MRMAKIDGASPGCMGVSNVAAMGKATLPEDEFGPCFQDPVRPISS